MDNKVRRHRQILAERTGWPDGVVDELGRVEDTCPGWHAWYVKDATGRDPEPDGYRAKPLSDVVGWGGSGVPPVKGRTADELIAAIG